MSGPREPKRRKAAEASKAKVKEIAEAEEIVSDVENEEVIEIPRTETKAVYVAPPEGFGFWNTTSTLTSGNKISDVAAYDESKQLFSHILKIEHPTAFTIKPLILNHGPYQGHHVFMLDPVTPHFRLMDLPPEIRNLIYSHLLEEDEGILISTAKQTYHPRRPVRCNYRYNKTRPINQLPSAHSILRVSKQVFQEAAPIAYGSNHFRFRDLGALKIFLDHIDGMRPYLSHIRIGPSGYYQNKARSSFHSLKKATGLRTLAFDHADVSRDDPPPRYTFSVSANRVVSDADMMLKALHRGHKKSNNGISILDIVKVMWHRCTKCQDTEPDYSANCVGNTPFKKTIECKDSAAHCVELEAKIRGLIAEGLGIDE